MPVAEQLCRTASTLGATLSEKGILGEQNALSFSASAMSFASWNHQFATIRLFALTRPCKMVGGPTPHDLSRVKTAMCAGILRKKVS